MNPQNLSSNPELQSQPPSPLWVEFLALWFPTLMDSSPNTPRQSCWVWVSLISACVWLLAGVLCFLLSSCAPSYSQARTILRRASPVPHTLRTDQGTEVLLPLIPVSPIERQAADEEIAILTLRGLIR